MIDAQRQPDGYVLLQCLRAYLDLNMYTGFNVHTMETIAAGEKALVVFSELMKVCSISVYILSNYHLISRCIKPFVRNVTMIARIGTFPKCIHMSMSFLTLWPRESPLVMTQNQMKEHMVHLKIHTD